MVLVTAQDVIDIFPRVLMPEEQARLEKLVAQALELVELEFARRGRILDREVEVYPWLALAVKHAVRVMVTRAVLVGDNVGLASASSSTGQESDSVTFSQDVGIFWGGVGIDDEILRLLGLIGAVPRGRGGVVIPFGERRRRHEAEFGEQRRC